MVAKNIYDNPGWSYGVGRRNVVGCGSSSRRVVVDFCVVVVLLLVAVLTCCCDPFSIVLFSATE